MEKLQRPFDIVEVKKLHNLVAACQLFVYNFLNNNNSKRIYFPTQLKTCLDLSQSFFLPKYYYNKRYNSFLQENGGSITARMKKGNGIYIGKKLYLENLLDS